MKFREWICRPTGGGLRKYVALLFFLFLPFTVLGERGYFDLQALELVDKGDNEYKFRFIQLSQPFGYKHKEDKEIVVHLRFKCPVYECLDDDIYPTEKKYLAAIEFLKNQIAASDKIKFGVVDRGYAEIEGTLNEYQSNSLEIHEGVVCSDYDFFDY